MSNWNVAIPRNPFMHQTQSNGANKITNIYVQNTFVYITAFNLYNTLKEVGSTIDPTLFFLYIFKSISIYF